MYCIIVCLYVCKYGIHTHTHTHTHTYIYSSLSTHCWIFRVYPYLLYPAGLCKIGRRILSIHWHFYAGQSSSLLLLLFIVYVYRIFSTKMFHQGSLSISSNEGNIPQKCILQIYVYVLLFQNISLYSILNKSVRFCFFPSSNSLVSLSLFHIYSHMHKHTHRQTLQT